MGEPGLDGMPGRTINGIAGRPGEDGRDGEPGERGTQGRPGEDGTFVSDDRLIDLLTNCQLVINQVLCIRKPQ